MTKNERKQRRQELSLQRKQRKKAGALGSRLIAQSFFLHVLGVFTNTIYRWLANGLFGRMFTAYSKQERYFEQGAVRGYFTNRGSAILRKIREKLSKAFESSYFLRKLKRVAYASFEMPLRYYGTILLSFGVYSSLILFVRQLTTGEYFWNEISFVVVIVAIITALPLYFSNESLGNAFVNGKITRTIFVELLGFREEDVVINSTYNRSKANLAIIWGMLAGLLTAVINAEYMLLIVLLAIFLTFIFILPEIGVLVSLFIVPFCSFFKNPSIILVGLVLLTSLSYVIKLVRGKRVFKLELVDAFVVIFAVLISMSGIISAGGAESFATASLSVCLMLGYFLVVNLIRTKEWVGRCINAILASGVITAMLGIMQFVLGDVDKAWLDTEYFSSIK